MKRAPSLNRFLLLSCVGAVFLVFQSGCGSQEQTAISQLSSPSFALSGSGTSTVGAVAYLFATSAGTIDTSGNTVTATFADQFLPLSLYSTSAYYDQMNTGSCSTLGTLVAAVAGASGNQVKTQVSATGCSDQATINVLLDTTQILDNESLSGRDDVSLSVTVDVAPKITAALTGNSTAAGTGTTESASGYYSLSTDQSIVATFSKSLASGTFNATLTGCAATLNAANVVANSNNQTLIWTLGNLTAVVAGNTCTLNVSGVTDAAGNPDDPSDPNLSMTFTFH